MFRLLFLLCLLIAFFNPVTQIWLAEKLVVDDGLEPSDVVVALRGQEEQRVRTDEAVSILHRRYAKTLLVDVSSVPYFGHSERELISDYLKKKMVDAKQMENCENSADSTAEEASAVRDCLLRNGAKSVIVVTSDYHTRRARYIFQRVLAGTGITVRVHPVVNKEYWEPHWWQQRRWAKTMFSECEKFTWTLIESLAGRIRRSSPTKISRAIFCLPQQLLSLSV
jgi:uncharacterized SAM-binding protein YcdF (DUF218 family)